MEIRREAFIFATLRNIQIQKLGKHCSSFGRHRPKVKVTWVSESQESLVQKSRENRFTVLGQRWPHILWTSWMYWAGQCEHDRSSTGFYLISSSLSNIPSVPEKQIFFFAFSFMLSTRFISGTQKVCCHIWLVVMCGRLRWISMSAFPHHAPYNTPGVLSSLSNDLLLTLFHSKLWAKFFLFYILSANWWIVFTSLKVFNHGWVCQLDPS